MRRSDVENYLPGAVLPKVDRMSMRHSLEVRTPFLNVNLARFAERLPNRLLVQNGRGKVLLREVAYRYLPAHLIDLPKQGFALPMSDWGRDSPLQVAEKLLEDDDSRLAAAFGSDRIGAFLARQRTPGKFAAFQTWAVAMLESWLRYHPAKIDDVEVSRAAQRNAWITGRGAAALPSVSVTPKAISMFEHSNQGVFSAEHTAAARQRVEALLSTLPLPLKRWTRRFLKLIWWFATPWAMPARLGFLRERGGQNLGCVHVLALHLSRVKNRTLILMNKTSKSKTRAPAHAWRCQSS